METNRGQKAAGDGQLNNTREREDRGLEVAEGRGGSERREEDRSTASFSRRRV